MTFTDLLIWYGYGFVVTAFGAYESDVNCSEYLAMIAVTTAAAIFWPIIIPATVVSKILKG
jgi:hypothetical protein